jgi:hypothetical protein
MKKSELKQLIKETLHEIKVVNPKNTYSVSSPEYKKFYQYVELTNYWSPDTSVNPEGDVYFDPLNDFYFFYMIYTVADENNWGPDRCIITGKNFEDMLDSYGLDEEEDKDKIEQIKAKFREHHH